MSARAIAILGMHRSGTSMVARGINLMGAYIGEEKDLMGPAPDNPAGFWERWDLMEFHDRVLQSMGRTWDDPSPMPAWRTLPQAEEFESELVQILSSVYKGQAIWAFKDPRVCLLLPLWKNALVRFKTTLSAVLIFRNPLDVAESLKVRNGYSRQKSLSLWELYNQKILADIGETFLARTSFYGLLQNPEQEFQRIAMALKLPSNEDSIKAAASSIRPGLIHHKTENIQQLPQNLACLLRDLESPFVE